MLQETDMYGQKVRIQHFDSMGEFLADALEARRESSRFNKGNSWNGARTFREAADIVRNGLHNAMADINSLTEQVSVELPNYQDVWEPSVQGPVPIVPAAIAGLPDNMLTMVRQDIVGVPLRIWVSTAYSSGCSDSMIYKRGVAITALLQAVSTSRPVDIMLFAEFDDAGARGLHTPVIRVQSMPLDLSTLTAALTSQCVSRCLIMGWCDTNPGGFRGTWAWGTNPRDKKERDKTRAALGVAHSDLFIPAAYLSEQDDIIKNPVKWVREQVELSERLARGEEEPTEESSHDDDY